MQNILKQEKYMVLTSAILLIILVAIVISLLIIKRNINEPFNNSLSSMFIYDCKTPLEKLKPYVNNCPQHNNMSNNSRLNLNNMGPLKAFHQCFNGSSTIPELQWRVIYEHNNNTVSNVNQLDENMIQTVNPIDNVYKTVNY